MQVDVSSKHVIMRRGKSSDELCFYNLHPVLDDVVDPRSPLARPVPGLLTHLSCLSGPAAWGNPLLPGLSLPPSDATLRHSRPGDLNHAPR